MGPWTWKLRNEIIEAQTNVLQYPVINLNGPYGDGNQVNLFCPSRFVYVCFQEWHNYEVVVMIGGGIGVTPYASTLMDLVLEKKSGNHSGIKCKKVKNNLRFKIHVAPELELESNMEEEWN